MEGAVVLIEVVVVGLPVDVADAGSGPLLVVPNACCVVALAPWCSFWWDWGVLGRPFGGQNEIPAPVFSANGDPTYSMVKEHANSSRPS